MKKITIGFSSHKGFAPGSWLIKLILNKSFSHTYFKFKQEDIQGNTIFHAVGKGLGYISEENFLKHNKVIAEYNIEITDELFIELMNDCHKNASADYAYLQNLGIVIIRGLRRLGINCRKNPFTSGMNCSEWISYVIDEIYPQWTKEDFNLVGPDQAFDFLESNYGNNDKSR